MPANYDSSAVGAPYVRSHELRIFYPENNLAPSVIISQKLAVKLADGSIRSLEELTPINVTFNMVADGATPIPLVDPTTGAALGPSTTLQQVMLGILAVVRREQNKG